MSKAITVAEAIRTRLLTAPASNEIPTLVNLTALGAAGIIVDRQKEVLELVSTAVGKAVGTAIVILWDGHSVANENTGKPRMNYSYTLQVWSRPKLASGAFPADDVMESIIARMWQWIPSGGHSHHEVKIRPGGMVPNKSYLIYDLGVLVPVSY